MDTSELWERFLKEYYQGQLSNTMKFNTNVILAEQYCTQHFEERWDLAEEKTWEELIAWDPVYADVRVLFT